MNSDILALKEKLDKIKNLGWIECKNKNKSVTGKTLENLLEINPDNFEIPDYNTIEIKSKVSKRENYIDLFCATPDSYVLETKRLYDKYAYLDSNNYKILNFVLYGEFLKPINNKYSAKLQQIQLSQHKFIYFFPLFIKKPSPFIEIPDQIPYMNSQKSDILIGCPGMMMNNRDIRVKNSFVFPVNSPRQIDILGIHKESFVKHSDIFQRLRAQEHEAARKIGNFHDFIVT